MGVDDGRILLPCLAVCAAIGLAMSEEAIQQGLEANPRPLSFYKDIAPILDKKGCSAAACHGGEGGKGEFRLSPMTLSPEKDYEPVALDARGRRINLLEPRSSLLLLKATNTIPHDGGQRFAVGSPEYLTLLQWIKEGATSRPNEPSVVRLFVKPDRLFVQNQGETKPLQVTATFSDGEAMDVTNRAIYMARDETMAQVDENGVVQRVRWGETSILVRFSGHFAFCVVTMPRESAGPDVLEAPGNPVDKHVFYKLRALHLQPSRRTTDLEFIRRLYLDTLGMLPTPEEVEQFLQEEHPQKRSKLIDVILERPEYAEYQALRLMDLLPAGNAGPNRNIRKGEGLGPSSTWIPPNAAELPFNQFVDALLLRKQSKSQECPLEVGWSILSPEASAEWVARAFLGIRLECARCHTAPSDRWTPQDYQNFAAFFTIPRPDSAHASGEKNEDSVSLAPSMGDAENGSSPETRSPVFFDGEKVSKNEETELQGSLRKWITASHNPYFAKAAANRLCLYYLGRGVVHPVDDIRFTLPPTVEGLLDALAVEMVEHQFDLRHVTRVILNSRTYQLASETNETNALDNRFFSHYLAKPMDARVLLRVLCRLFLPEASQGSSGSLITIPSIHSGPFPASLRSFREELLLSLRFNTEKESNQAPIPAFSETPSVPGGGPGARIVRQLVRQGLSDEAIMRRVYLLLLTRIPTPSELNRALDTVRKAPSREEALEELFWSLLHSPEFHLAS